MSLQRIFVQIPSYRDRECQWTLRDMFERARHPERVFAGVCWQVIPEEDQDCFLIRPRPDQVRSVELHASEARGLGWARQKAQDLWQGEEYTLQIDSHMRFADDWDVRMFAALEACDSPDPVLTVYPESYFPPDERQSSPRPPVQMIKGFNPNGLLDFTASRVPEDAPLDRPFPTAALAGGFIFGSSRMLHDVPADPGIYFNGEEPNLAVRLFTAGFDLFSPHETLIYHYYYRRDGSRHWNDAPSHDTMNLHSRTLRRMRLLCEPGAFRPDEVAELGRYGLGTQRSLAEYERFAGVNFAARTLTKYARKFPWVLPPHEPLPVTLSPSLRPADGTELFVIGDEGVLFSAQHGTMHRLNEAASFAWCALDAGLDWQQIAEQAAAARAIPEAAALEELRNLAVGWIGEGMLVDTSVEAKTGPRIDPADFDFRDHDYALLDSFIRLRCGDAELEALIHPAFAHLELPSTGITPNVTLRIFRILDWFYIFAGDAMLHIGDSRAALVPKLKAELLRLAVDGQGHILHLHSAAVMLGDKLLMLPAASGSGKTVMTARLVSLGCSYLSDEAVLLARSDGTIRPVPTALSVKTGAVELLAPFYPGLADLVEHDREDGISVRYLAPNRSSLRPHSQRTKPDFIVFRRYVADAPTRMRKLSAAEALGRLLAECIAIPRRLDSRGAATIIEMIERASCWELVSGNLEDAAVQLMGLLGEAKRETAENVSAI